MHVLDAPDQMHCKTPPKFFVATPVTINSIQYNTIQYNWPFDIAFLTLKFRSALTRLGGADAVLQSIIVCEGPYTVTVSDEARIRILYVTGRAL